MSTPDRVDMSGRLQPEKSKHFQRFFEKKMKFEAKKLRIPLALLEEMVYNMNVVCLWDETASCRPALAGNCSGPARPDRATGSHFPPLTMRYGEGKSEGF